MLPEYPHPIIFAHRGAAAYAPENTLASFKTALDQGADAIELDAKLSADGYVVVCHDRTLNRTTNGTGELSRKTLAELRELDAGCHFSTKFAGEKIPLLEEVFETVGKKLLINVELTNYATPYDQLVEKVCALVIKHGLEGGVLFSSFFPLNLKKAFRLIPNVPQGLGIYFRNDSRIIFASRENLPLGVCKRLSMRGIIPRNKDQRSRCQKAYF